MTRTPRESVKGRRPLDSLEFLTALGLALLLAAGCMSRPRYSKGVMPISADSQAALRAAEPGALPSLEEEVWVIARGEVPELGRAELPGTGALVAKGPQGRDVPLPLKHTEVKAVVNGYLASVWVTQQYHNPFKEKIEAVYTFPLPHNAAVSDFLLIIGERRIRGIIRERVEAERIYAEARSQGYVASLLTQERPNVFTQAVANLEPGRQIEVALTYFHTLAYDDGWYEWVFPMVVGPRFNPPGFASGVGAVARGQAGLSGQQTEVQYLRPGERSGHDIALEVDLAPGVSLEECVCRTHAVTTEKLSAGRWTVKLAPGDSLPNKDFVLRYRVAGDRLKANLIAAQTDQGGFFTFLLYPPKDLDRLARQPLEIVVVLDCSGSMSGWPINQAKHAARRLLGRLRADDTFQIIRFSDSASALGAAPVPATPENLRQGLDYLARLTSEGGTMMLEGIRAALDFPHDPGRLRFVCFLTDGYIGNEAQILGETQRRLGEARLFSFGVGSSVNRYLLEHLAKLGKGAVAYLGPNDSAADVIDRFHERISHPALTDLVLDWQGVRVSDVFPQRVPDLFVGRPVILTGRFTGQAPGGVRVRGRAAGRFLELNVPGRQVAANTDRSLPSVWARLKLAELMDQGAAAPGNTWLPGQIKDLALEFGLLSPYTAFVAVDTTRRTEGEPGLTVPVAVPMPEGVEYETTVQEGPDGDATAARKDED